MKMKKERKGRGEGKEKEKEKRKEKGKEKDKKEKDKKEKDKEKEKEIMCIRPCMGLSVHLEGEAGAGANVVGSQTIGLKNYSFALTNRIFPLMNPSSPPRSSTKVKVEHLGLVHLGLLHLGAGP